MRTLQKAALVLGGVYIAVGLAGFIVTGFTPLVEPGNAKLLIFEVNPFHNIVHLVVGGMWILASRLESPGGTEGVFLGIGSVYLGAAILGFMGALPILGITSTLAASNFLHLATAVATLLAIPLLGDLRTLSDRPTTRTLQAARQAS